MSGMAGRRLEVRCGSCGHRHRLSACEPGSEVRFACPACGKDQVANIPRDPVGERIVSHAPIELFGEDACKAAPDASWNEEEVVSDDSESVLDTLRVSGSTEFVRKRVAQHVALLDRQLALLDASIRRLKEQTRDACKGHGQVGGPSFAGFLRVLLRMAFLVPFLGPWAFYLAVLPEMGGESRPGPRSSTMRWRARQLLAELEKPQPTEVPVSPLLGEQARLKHQRFILLRLLKSRGVLPWLLNRAGPLPLACAVFTVLALLSGLVGALNASAAVVALAVTALVAFWLWRGLFSPMHIALRTSRLYFTPPGALPGRRFYPAVCLAAALASLVLAAVIAMKVLAWAGAGT